MQRLWIGLLALMLVTTPTLALELSGTWIDNNGTVYVLRQQGKKVTIQAPQQKIIGQLNEDDTFLESNQATFQWVDDDTLLLKSGSLGKVTRLRRQ